MLTMSDNMPAGLYAQDLLVIRGARTLLKQISFSVQAGQILELRGPNGCGKTTLLRILCGLGKPDSGQSLRVGDFHFCGHNDAVKQNFTVLDQLRFWAKIHNTTPDTISEALAQMELQKLADLPGGWLSAGQKKRLALARLFIAPKPLWLLDEPFSGLDDQAQSKLNMLAKTHCQQGGLIVAAAHGKGFSGARHLDLTNPPSAFVSIPISTETSRDKLLFPDCFATLVQREIQSSWSGGALPLTPSMFFAGCAALIPLGLKPKTELLGLMAPGLIMAALALASLLPQERLFHNNLEDGTLDVLLCSGVAPETVATSTLIGQWIGTGLTLAVLSPAIWLPLQGQVDAIHIVLAATFTASLAMFSLGSIAAALSIGSKRSGLLIANLALPLYWPIMIFASSAMQNAQNGISPLEPLMLSAALALFMLALAPFAIAACISAALDR